MSDASDWCDGLREAIALYGRTRRTGAVVKVTLDSDDSFFVMGAEPAGESLVMLSAYPPGRPGEEVLKALVKGLDDDFFYAASSSRSSSPRSAH
jgi:hypothetical protein